MNKNNTSTIKKEEKRYISTHLLHHTLILETLQEFLLDFHSSFNLHDMNEGNNSNF